MGLDGISPNQLRQLTEVNSAELNSILKPNQNLNTRAVDGLSEGQKVDPDKEKNDDHAFSQSSDDENDTKDDDEKENEKFNSYKIDLSQTNKYELKMNEKSNSILIVEKDTQKTVQVISADNLAIFVKNMVEAKGAMVNRKF